jgi:hypothetical protein
MWHVAKTMQALFQTKENYTWLEPMTVGNSEMEIIHNPKTAMNSNNNNHS